MEPGFPFDAGNMESQLLPVNPPEPTVLGDSGNPEFQVIKEPGVPGD